MKYFSGAAALVALSIVGSTQAHTAFTNFFVNSVNQGDGTCVRMNNDPAKATFPIENLASDDMACGFNGKNGVPRVCPASAGDEITFEFRDRPDTPGGGAIDPSHKGPCAVYMKKVDSAVKDTAAGDGWFKIWDDGYDQNAGKWCTEKLIADSGHLSVNIPGDIAGGYYLIRPELLALHSAANNPPDPQFYTGCAQIYLESKGSAIPENTVSIPGYVKISDPAMTFNIYEKPMKLPYPMYGPPAYKTSDGKSNFVSKIKQQPQTEGFQLKNTVLESGNWDGTELSKYSDETGCWETGKQCWTQNDACWKAAPPTGGKNCKIWQQKCQDINDACKAKNFNGPPDYMKNLTPKPSFVALPAPRQGIDGVKGSASAKAEGPAPSSSSSAAPVSSSPKPSAFGTFSIAATPSSTPSNAPTTLATMTKNKVPMVTKYAVVTNVKVDTVTKTVVVGKHRHARHV
ncbi:MAG: 10 kDa heat shock protein [Chaenotheca gracillima]|nr:MAG: 10 kDa heat shock protein [Chaenotheca gracillima]